MDLLTYLAGWLCGVRGGCLRAAFDSDHWSDGGRAGDEAVFVPAAARRQPDRVPRRGRLPGRPADARLAAEVLGALRGRKASVGPGPRRRDRRGRGAGGPAAAHRRQVGRIGRRSEPFDQPAGMAGGRRAKGRAAARAPARQPHAGPSGRLPGDYPRAHLRRSGGPGFPAVAVARPAEPRIVWAAGRPPEGHGHHAALDRHAAASSTPAAS